MQKLLNNFYRYYNYLISLNHFILKFFNNKSVLVNFLILFSLTSFLFLLGHGLLNLDNWNYILGYQGDGLLQHGIAKGILEGNIYLHDKEVNSLGAPTVANWSGYPITEEIIYYLYAIYAFLFGLNHSLIITLFTAQLLAVLTFWGVCRYYKFNNLLSIAGAIVFGFSHYLFSRGIGHIVLTFCWHIPILLLIIEHIHTKKKLPIFSKFTLFGIAVSFIAGLQNPYYSIMYCQFILFAILFKCFRKDFEDIYVPFLFIIFCSLAFFISNIDTLFFAEVSDAKLRNLASMEVFALKIPELFLPAYGNPWQSLSNFAYENYYNLSYVKGELWGPYLGIFGIIGFTSLIVFAIRKIALNQYNLVPIGFWQSGWILLYSLIGGVNLFIGVFGFQYLRATNRYSIYILVISLIFLIKILSKYSPKVLIIPISFLMIFYGYAENYGLTYRHSLSSIDQKYLVDKKIFSEIEKSFPNSNVFNLPIMVFPENGSIHKMTDYDHFRPYLHTKTLKYSYGDYKFRNPTPFQDTLRDLSMEDMFYHIRNRGFDMVLINKLGYPDNGSFIKELLIKKKQDLLVDEGDFIVFKLNDHLISNFKIKKIFSSGWSTDELTHIWSINSESTIDLLVPKNNLIQSLAFQIWSLNKRSINIYLNDKLIENLNIIESNKRYSVYLKNLTLKQGINILKLTSTEPPVSPGNGDLRQLFFSVTNFEFLEN